MLSVSSFSVSQPVTRFGASAESPSPSAASDAPERTTREVRPAIDKLLTHLPTSVQPATTDVVDLGHALVEQAVEGGKQALGQLPSTETVGNSIKDLPGQVIQGLARRACWATAKTMLALSVFTGGCTATSVVVPQVSNEAGIHQDAKNGIETLSGYSTVGGTAATGLLMSGAAASAGLGLMTRRKKKK